MSVRYVLTAVLPRYTMRPPPRPDPSARTARRIADQSEDVDLELRRIMADALRRDLGVMGHD